MKQSDVKIDLSIDYHSHILPGCDHGSDGIETSLKQISMAADANIRTICATPHFYPHREPLDDFIKRRTDTARLLMEKLPSGSPKIQLGAEVLICDGLNKMKNLSSLCLENTDELLLEMPFYKWSESIWDTLLSLTESRDIHIVMAHAERYPKENIETLIKLGVPLQLNARCVVKSVRKKQYIEWIEKGYVKYLGSDIHMLDNAYRDWPKCRKVIEKLR